MHLLKNHPSMSCFCHWCRRLSSYLILFLLPIWFLLEVSERPLVFLTEQERMLFNISTTTASRVPEATVKYDVERRCFPAINIAFLKTHKCASTTVQNILFRYAWQNHLRIACPLQGNYFGRNKAIAAEIAETPWNHLELNIFAIHTKWNHKQVVSIMPKDTIYISIVREPVAQFESLYNYCGLGQKGQEGIENYLRTHNRTSERTYGFFGLNQMNCDFGLSLDQMNNITAVHQLVAAADMQFDLVLVADRMNESLVLLKNLLCWPMEDVIAFQLNARTSQFKTELNDDLLAKLRLELEPDYILYNHFRKKFDNLVEQFGADRMAKELEDLRQKTEEVVDRCNIGKLRPTNHEKAQIPKLESYKVLRDDDFCEKFTIEELVFLDKLRNRQLNEVKKTP